MQCSWCATFWDGSGSLNPCTGLRIRILLFRQWLSRWLLKKSFFASYYICISLLTEQVKSRFSMFFFVDGRIRIRTNNSASGPWRPKNLRIRGRRGGGGGGVCKEIRRLTVCCMLAKERGLATGICRCNSASRAGNNKIFPMLVKRTN